MRKQIKNESGPTQKSKRKGKMGTLKGLQRLKSARMKENTEETPIYSDEDLYDIEHLGCPNYPNCDTEGCGNE